MKGGLISKGILIFFYPQEIRLLTKHHQRFGKEEMIFELMQIWSDTLTYAILNKN